jgi:predicted negative regulator of RcsB-dependent stress response
VILGVVLGLGAVLGWRGWQGYEHRQAVRGSAGYEQLLDLVAQGDTAKAVAQGDALIQDQPRSLYAALGAMILARLAADQGDLATAAQRLDWVLSTASVEAVKPAARLQLARVRLAEGKLDEALALASAAAPAEFAPVYAELRGDIFFARGETELARAAYQESLAALDHNAPTRALVQMKLDDLGGESAASAAARSGS